MKKILKTVICIGVVLIMCLGLLCACNNNQEEVFDNVYHATLYDRAIDWLKQDLVENARWSNNEKTILITDEETFNSNLAEFPVEVDFEKQMVCGYLVTWTTNGFDYEIKSTKVFDSKLEIKIKAIVPKPGNNASSPILRCFVVVMDKVDVSEVSFVDYYSSRS